MKIQFDGAPYTIVDFQHVKPGKGARSCARSSST